MVKVDLVTGWYIQSKKYELVVPVYIVYNGLRYPQ